MIVCRVNEYKGVADELILARIAQKSDAEALLLMTGSLS